MSGNWITIQQYSINNNLSVSTIRRRIKSGSLKSKLINGKYEIFDPSSKTDSLKTQYSLKCPALTSLAEKDNRLSTLEKENLELKEQISEIKMLLKIIESKSGIKVSV